MSDADVGMAARAAFKAIQAKARAEQNKNTQGLLVVYGIQGFLRRLSMSPYATKMTLKGGMLMAAKNIRQMTKDADLSTHGVRNDQAELISLVTEIANITPEPHDGLVFATSTIKAELMREDADYHGVRVKAACSLSTARFGVALDFSFGDRDSVTMIDLPALLGDEPIRLAAYPFELNIAEKIATMMSRRELNTRAHARPPARLPAHARPDGVSVPSADHSRAADPSRDRVLRSAHRRRSWGPHGVGSGHAHVELSVRDPLSYP